MKYIRPFFENELNLNTFQMVQVAFEDFYQEFNYDDIHIHITNGNSLEAHNPIGGIQAHLGRLGLDNKASVVFSESLVSMEKRNSNATPRGFHSQLEYTQDLYEYFLDIIDKLKTEKIILERVLYCPSEFGVNDWIKHDKPSELLRPNEIYTVGTRAVVKGGINKPVVKINEFKYILLVFKGI